MVGSGGYDGCHMVVFRPNFSTYLHLQLYRNYNLVH